jgi:hypothetical protein
MAVICKQLENLGTSQSLESALAALTRLDREFDRVKIEIEHESVIPRVLPGPECCEKWMNSSSDAEK